MSGAQKIYVPFLALLLGGELLNLSESWSSK